jgi:hypothetical protein
MINLADFIEANPNYCNVKYQPLTKWVYLVIAGLFWEASIMDHHQDF